MENNTFFYQESGEVNPMRLALAYFFSLVLTIIVGYIYSVLILFIPIPYLNFLLTLGFGIFLGIAVRFLVRISHIRNRKKQIFLAVFLGISANYFQWTVYILYAYNGEIPNFTEYLTNLYWIVVPKNFFTAVVAINKIGLWSMFGITFNGFILTFIWIIEVLTIGTLPIVAIFKTTTYPYSELLLKWYPKYTISKDFESLSVTNKLLDDLKTNPINAIQGLGKGNGLRHTKIHLFFLKDEEKQYLTFEKVFIEEKGKGKKNIANVINNFLIDTNSAESILKLFENKKERFDVI